jgi:HsdM N-terminal domain
VDQATHNKIVSFIWSIADDVLRDLFKRGKYPDVILPMCVIRRMDAVLERESPGGKGCLWEQILVTVSRELPAECGSGFNYTALTRMARFAEWMTGQEIVSALSTQFGIAEVAA